MLKYFAGRALIVILMITILSASPLKAEAEEIVYHDMPLSEAVYELAELKGEEVIFASQPQATVTVSLSEDKSFQDNLEKLLAGTGYRFTHKRDYFLVGEFKPGSSEFAARSKSKFYEPEYIPADELIEVLDIPGVRLVNLTDNKILVQGLPQDIERAKEALKERDSEDNPHQVEYELTVVDIKEEKEKSLDFSGFELSTDPEDLVEFVAGEEVMELTAPEVLNYLELEAKRSSEVSERVARPGLVTTMGESGSLGFSEEIVQTEGEAGLSGTSMETVITPLKKSRNPGEIKSLVEVEVDGGASSFNTTTWLEPGELTMLGLMNLTQEKSSSSLTSRQEIDEERKFALFLTAEPEGTLRGEQEKEEERISFPSDDVDFSQLEEEKGTFSPEISLDGFDEMMLSGRDDSNAHLFETDTYQLLYGNGLDADIYMESYDWNISAAITSRRGDDFINLGVDYHLRETLKFGGRVKRHHEKGYALGPILYDRVNFFNYFNFTAAYQPFLYYPEEDEFLDHQGWAEIEFDPGPVFASLRYATEIEPEELRFETGVRLTSSVYITAAAAGDTGEVKRYLGGLRFRF